MNSPVYSKTFAPVALLNPTAAISSTTASTNTGIDRITNDSIVTAWSENWYWRMAPQAPARTPSVPPDDRRDQQEPQADADAPAHLGVHRLALPRLAEVPVQDALGPRLVALEDRRLVVEVQLGQPRIDRGLGRRRVAPLEVRARVQADRGEDVRARGRDCDKDHVIRQSAQKELGHVLPSEAGYWGTPPTEDKHSFRFCAPRVRGQLTIPRSPSRRTMSRAIVTRRRSCGSRRSSPQRSCTWRRR